MNEQTLSLTANKELNSLFVHAFDNACVKAKKRSEGYGWVAAERSPERYSELKTPNGLTDVFTDPVYKERDFRYFGKIPNRNSVIMLNAGEISEERAKRYSSAGFEPLQHFSLDLNNKAAGLQLTEGDALRFALSDIAPELLTELEQIITGTTKKEKTGDTSAEQIKPLRSKLVDVIRQRQQQMEK